MQGDGGGASHLCAAGQNTDGVALQQQHASIGHRPLTCLRLQLVKRLNGDTHHEVDVLQVYFSTQVSIPGTYIQLAINAHQ